MRDNARFNVFCTTTLPRHVKVLIPTELRGERSIDYPAQGNPCNTLPPSERRDLWGVGTVHDRML